MFDFRGCPVPGFFVAAHKFWAIFRAFLVKNASTRANFRDAQRSFGIRFSAHYRPSLSLVFSSKLILTLILLDVSIRSRKYIFMKINFLNRALRR
jgi:hypothetical protein